jgi:hypothetical protein
MAHFVVSVATSVIAIAPTASRELSRSSGSERRGRAAHNGFGRTERSGASDEVGARNGDHPRGTRQSFGS